jgi:hypothetical protein
MHNCILNLLQIFIPYTQHNPRTVVCLKFPYTNFIFPLLLVLGKWWISYDRKGSSINELKLIYKHIVFNKMHQISHLAINLFNLCNWTILSSTHVPWNWLQRLTTLTNSWEFNSHSASQEISCLLWNISGVVKEKIW